MIEETIELVISSHKPAPKSSLEGFQDDARLEFESGLGNNAELAVHVTQEPDCMVVFVVKPRHQASKLQVFEEYIITVWKRLAYRQFEASACEPYVEAIALRFVTMPTVGDYFITGIFLVVPRDYESLTNIYNQNYSRFTTIHPLAERWRPYLPVKE